MAAIRCMYDAVRIALFARLCVHDARTTHIKQCASERRTRTNNARSLRRRLMAPLFAIIFHLASYVPFCSVLFC